MLEGFYQYCIRKRNILGSFATFSSATISFHKVNAPGGARGGAQVIPNIQFPTSLSFHSCQDFLCAHVASRLSSRLSFIVLTNCTCKWCGQCIITTPALGRWDAVSYKLQTRKAFDNHAVTVYVVDLVAIRPEINSNKDFGLIYERKIVNFTFFERGHKRLEL